MALVGPVPPADAAADHIVVGQPPQMAVVGVTFLLGDHIAAGFAVDQQRQVAYLEMVLVGLSLVQF